MEELDCSNTYHLFLENVSFLHFASSLFAIQVCKDSSHRGLWSVPLTESEALIWKHDWLFIKNTEGNPWVVGRSELVLVFGRYWPALQWHLVKLFEVARVLFSQSWVLVELPLGYHYKQWVKGCNCFGGGGLPSPAVSRSASKSGLPKTNYSPGNERVVGLARPTSSFTKRQLVFLPSKTYSAFRYNVDFIVDLNNDQ